MRLQPFTHDVWFAEDDLWMAGIIHFPIRMVVVRLPDGGLWLHSPIAIDDALAGELAGLGPVRHLVAPSKMHHLFMADAVARYPDAEVHLAPGLAHKCKNLRADATLGESDEFEGVFDQVLVDGSAQFNEVVFLHRASKTLVCTDLVFNIREPRGWMTKLVLRMAGAHKRLAQSKLWRMVTKDRDAVRRSVETVLAWDFERVVMAHGTPLEGADTKARLASALYWMRGVTPPALPVAA